MNTNGRSTSRHHSKSKNMMFWFGLSVFVIAAAYLLFAEHRAHIAGAVPYLLLLLCLVMHFFMHGNHGAKYDNATKNSSDSHENPDK